MVCKFVRTALWFGLAASLGVCGLSASARAQSNDPVRCDGDFPDGIGRCIYQDGGYYTGEFAGGLPEGDGVYVLPGSDGGGRYTRYDGEWSAGKPDGSGVLLQDDGIRYEGFFQDGKLLSGEVFYPNGDRYQGPFLDVEGTPVADGIGRYFFANGDRYEGDFFNGEILGDGTITRSDGTRCVAEFYGSGLVGKGTCSYANDLVYEGELVNGRPYGRGVLIDAEGKRYEGFFRDGELVDFQS